MRCTTAQSTAQQALSAEQHATQAGQAVHPPRVDLQGHGQPQQGRAPEVRHWLGCPNSSIVLGPLLLL